MTTADGALSLRIDDSLGKMRSVMILNHAGGSTSVAMTSMLAEWIGISRGRFISLCLLRSRLADGCVSLHDPDLLFYLPMATAPTPVADLQITPRILTGVDRKAFAAFQREASAQDLADAYVELDHWAVFGAFDGDRLVSAASMYPWDGAMLADLGVLTLPDSRGRGYASATVHAISGFAREQGYEPQYRCQMDNTASIALARACGFQLFGKWEVVRCDAPGE